VSIKRKGITPTLFIQKSIVPITNSNNPEVGVE
jgi:hypothetical protein